MNLDQLFYNLFKEVAKVSDVYAPGIQSNFYRKKIQNSMNTIQDLAEVIKYIVEEERANNES